MEYAQYQGGKIFYLEANGCHGLIAALQDASVSIRWFNSAYKNTLATGDGLYAGKMNTTIIIATQAADLDDGDFVADGNFAARVAADYRRLGDGISSCSGLASEVCYGDWYLPSKQELNILYENKDIVGVEASGSFTYWSSTESSNINAFRQSFITGDQSHDIKEARGQVRPIRAF